MKARRWLFIFVGICVLLLAAGCSEESTADTNITAGQKAGSESSQEPLSNEQPILDDEQPTADIVDWQKAVGTWEDENGRGYTMHVSVNESETDILFSISFVPHGSVSLNWVLPCKLDDEILRYDIVAGRMSCI